MTFAFIVQERQIWYDICGREEVAVRHGAGSVKNHQTTANVESDDAQHDRDNDPTRHLFFVNVQSSILILRV